MSVNAEEVRMRLNAARERGRLPFEAAGESLWLWTGMLESGISSRQGAEEHSRIVSEWLDAEMDFPGQMMIAKGYAEYLGERVDVHTIGPSAQAALDAAWRRGVRATTSRRPIRTQGPRRDVRRRHGRHPYQEFARGGLGWQLDGVASASWARLRLDSSPGSRQAFRWSANSGISPFGYSSQGGSGRIRVVGTSGRHPRPDGQRRPTILREIGGTGRLVTALWSLTMVLVSKVPEMLGPRADVLLAVAGPFENLHFCKLPPPVGDLVGREVLVSTTSNDYATIAYDAATGVDRRSQRYEGPGETDDPGTNPSNLSISTSSAGIVRIVAGRAPTRFCQLPPERT